MTVMLELKPETEALAKAQADAQGVPMEDYLNVILEEDLTARRNAEIRRRNIERNAPAIALLDKFLKTDEYGTAEEQRETLEYLKKAVDEDRSGQRSVFGKGFNPQ